MSVLITYDLNKSGQNYQALEKAITSAFSSYAKIATTTFVVVADNSTKEIAEYLRKYMDSNDELFVINLTRDAHWYTNSQEITNWLQRNL